MTIRHGEVRQCLCTKHGRRALSLWKRTMKV